MQIGKARFVGSSVRFTTSQVYDMLAISGGSFSVLDDNNELFSASLGADWDLEYLAVVELKQLYP